jgi:hypothetical protein
MDKQFHEGNHTENEIFLQKLELLKLVSNLAESEANRAWSRYTVMLYANTALLGIVAWVLTNGAQAAAFPPAFAGALCSLAWWRITNLSDYYQSRWHADMEALTESDETLAEWVRGRNHPRIPMRKGKPVYFWAQFAPISYFMLWISLVAVFILAFFFEPLGQILRALAKTAAP